MAEYLATRRIMPPGPRSSVAQSAKPSTLTITLGTIAPAVAGGLINAEPIEAAVGGDRERLEAQYGRVWHTQQLQEDYQVLAFTAPLIVVRERGTGRMGSLFFQHSPRLYWGFTPN